MFDSSNNDETIVGKDLTGFLDVSEDETRRLLIESKMDKYAKKKVTPLPKITESRLGPPVAYGYGRVSTDKQYAKEDSIEQQERRAKQYYDMYLKDKGVIWGGFVDDGKGTSATKIPMMERKAGSELMNKLRPGDHVIFDKIDRMWRKVKDFCIITEWFEKHEISMHIVNMGGTSINTSSHIGKILLTLLACFAEAEATMTGQRIKDAMYARRVSGESTRCLIGTKYITRGDKRRLVWDVEMRNKMRRVMELKDNEYYNFVEIVTLFENERRIAEGMQPMSDIVQRRFLTSTRKLEWMKPYLIEKAIQILGITDPLMLPTSHELFDIARRYNRQHQPNWENERKIKLGERTSMPVIPNSR